MKLDSFEKELLESVENGEWNSVDNLEERKSDIQKYISTQKKKAISLRLSENDYHEIKKRGLESGIPYQNLIQMLIHQFLKGRIELKV